MELLWQSSFVTKTFQKHVKFADVHEYAFQFMKPFPLSSLCPCKMKHQSPATSSSHTVAQQSDTRTVGGRQAPI